MTSFIHFPLFSLGVRLTPRLGLPVLYLCDSGTALVVLCPLQDNNPISDIFFFQRQVMRSSPNTAATGFENTSRQACFVLKCFRDAM
ncbi:hypothetical protein HDK64DRAFT_268704 [Phyllosticta capitalensis]